MAVLVIAEHHHGALSDATHKVVTAASKFGGDVDLLVAGENAGAVAPEAAKVSGVRKVLKAEGESLRKQTAEAMEALVVPLMANYDAVFIAATTTGKNIAPRIAAKLDVMQLSEITAVIDASTFERPIYAGNAILTVKSSDAKKVVTVRGTSFEAAGNDGSAAVEDVAAPAGPFRSEFVSEEMVKSEKSVDIATLKAQADVQQATGEAKSTQLRAEGEANAIRSTGQARAEVYRLGVEALGTQGFTTLQMMQIVGDKAVRIVPDVAVNGNSGGGGLAEGLLGLVLREKSGE